MGAAELGAEGHLLTENFVTGGVSATYPEKVILISIYKKTKEIGGVSATLQE